MSSEESPAMTGDELAVALYAEQGFLILASDVLRENGSIAREEAHGGTIPLVIVGRATERDHHQQDALAVRKGWAPLVISPVRYRYFYRVEAAD